MTISRSKLCSLAMWTAAAVHVPSAFAQSSAVRAGSVEIGPFVGFSDGASEFHALYGGNITYAFKNRWVLPYFEVSDFPSAFRYSAPATGGNITYHQGLVDYHGGVHIRFPIHESPIVPYLVFGVGGLYSEATSYQVAPSCTGCTGHKDDVPGSTSFAFNAGGGIRYYIGGSGAFGLRLEGKIYHGDSGALSGANIGKVEIGFFFQIH